jgi:hypothetical protein
MRTVTWLVAAGLLASATGCVETNGYPGTSYGGYPSGYGGYPSSGYYGQQAYSPTSSLLGSLFNQQPAYYQQPTYYQQPAYYQQPTYYQPPPQVVTQPRYVPVPVASNPRSSWGSRDRNNNGVPDWKERDRNGDGVPDWQQRRNRSG